MLVVTSDFVDMSMVFGWLCFCGVVFVVAMVVVIVVVVCSCSCVKVCVCFCMSVYVCVWLWVGLNSVTAAVVGFDCVFVFVLHGAFERIWKHLRAFESIWEHLGAYAYKYIP